MTLHNPWARAAALLCLAAAAHAAPPSVTAGCPQPRDAQSFDAAFTAATVQRHSLQQLTCAAAMSFAAAGRAAADPDMQILALDAQMNLLEAVQQQLDTQVYQGGDAYEDLKARWALGVRQGKLLSQRLAKPAQQEPSIAGIRIAFDLVSVSSSLVPPDVAYRNAAQAFKPLGELLQKNPQLLDGVGEHMLGRLYFQLPETSGGDLDKAATHLVRAQQIAKKNIEFIRWAAESLVALDRKAEARDAGPAAADPARAHPAPAPGRRAARRHRPGTAIGRRGPGQ